MKKLCKVFFCTFICFFALVGVQAALVDNFVSTSSESLKVFNGTANNHNVTELVKAQSLILQNKDVVATFLENISGADYKNLRAYIGIDDNGNVTNTTAVQAVYTIATILDTNRYYAQNNCDQGFSMYSSNFTAESNANKNDGFVLHVPLISMESGNKIDPTTWSRIKEMPQNGAAAYNELENYFNTYVNGNNLNTIGATSCGDGESYLKYDPNAKIEGGISIATGDGESADGDSANSAVDDAIDDIVDNSVASRADAIVNENTESSTGVDMDNRINETYNFIFEDPTYKNNGVPSMNLDTLTNRLQGLKDSGTLSQFDEFNDIIENDILGMVLQIGRYLIYAALLFFGVRCIWEGASGKAQFKSMLPYLLVALVFFYSGRGLVNVVQSVFDTYDYANYGMDVFASIVYIVRILAFAGILFTGVKLMFASAEAKADVKAHLIPIIIGCVFVFSSSFIVDVIVTTLDDAGFERSNIVIEKNIDIM